MLDIVIKSACAALGIAYLDGKHFIADDLRRIKTLVTVKMLLNSNDSKDRNSVWYVFEQQVKNRSNAECYRFEGASMSWTQVDVGESSLTLAPSQ
jgi:hypothetical protein